MYSIVSSSSSSSISLLDGGRRSKRISIVVTCIN